IGLKAPKCHDLVSLAPLPSMPHFHPLPCPPRTSRFLTCNGLASLEEIHLELGWSTHAVFEYRIINIGPTYLIRITRKAMPDVLDPQNSYSGFLCEAFREVRQMGELGAGFF